MHPQKIDGEIRPRPRGHTDHANDPANCRMPFTTERRRRTRGAGTQHPREGRELASEDPDGDATTHDLTETNEIQQPPDLTDRAPRTSTPSASSHEPASSSAQPLERVQRSDKRIPRGPLVREFAGGTDSSPSDWTRFSIDKNPRVPKIGTDEQRRKELRKLDLRWWRAPERLCKTS